MSTWSDISVPCLHSEHLYLIPVSVKVLFD